jgi:hypothetical protein
MTRRAGVAILVTACAGVAATVAGAGFTPAWSYLPAAVRGQLADASGATLYLPARTPPFYRYRSGARVTAGVLSVPFTNRVRVRQGLWKWTSQTLLWQVQPLPGSTGCSRWRTNTKTLQLSGNLVYSTSTPTQGSIAWRCVTDRTGRTLVMSSSTVSAGDQVGMGVVVASGLDVSRRISGVTVALTVTPRTVRRGGTVLVRGVAGGCTAGDTVTIISRAFPGTHSFAGVPAVFGSVGSAGRFSAKARIPITRSNGTYTVTARCGGGNLGVAAQLTVTR